MKNKNALKTIIYIINCILIYLYFDYLGNTIAEWSLWSFDYDSVFWLDWLTLISTAFVLLYLTAYNDKSSLRSLILITKAALAYSFFCYQSEMDWYLFDKMEYLDEDGSGGFMVYYLDWVTVISTALIFIYLTLFDRNKNSTSSTSSGDACLTGEEVIEVTPDHKININSATVEDLKSIPSVGDVAAIAIINNRPFSGFNDLLILNGVGPALVKKLQVWCTIEHPSIALLETFEESLCNLSHEEKIVLLTVSIASLMANADHKILPSESKIIKKWRDESLKSIGLKANSNAQLKRGFNASTLLLKADHFIDRFIDTVCGEFELLSAQSEKNTMLDLCFHIMVADDYLHINEARIINEFSNRCGISSKQLNNYKDKLILEERLVFDTTVPLDVFYGIDFSDDVESSKKFLMNEFRKWNMRINTLSPVKRDGAQRMIDRISDACKRLK